MLHGSIHKRRIRANLYVQSHFTDKLVRILGVNAAMEHLTMKSENAEMRHYGTDEKGMNKDISFILMRLCHTRYNTA